VLKPKAPKQQLQALLSGNFTHLVLVLLVTAVMLKPTLCILYQWNQELTLNTRKS